MKLSPWVITKRHPKASFDTSLGGIAPEPKDLDDEEDDFGLCAEHPGDDKRKQATTHINFASDDVLKTTGEAEETWLDAGRNEIDNLTVSRTEGQKTGALLQKKKRLKAEARKDGSQYVELPAKAGWFERKCRIATRGSQTQDIPGICFLQPYPQDMEDQ